MHFSGNMLEKPIGEEVSVFSEEKPYKHMHSIVKLQSGKNHSIYQDEEVVTWVFSMETNQQVFVGMGPDNPSISDINYRIERADGPKAVFAHVIATAKEKQHETDLTMHETKDCANRIENNNHNCPVKKVWFEQEADSVTIHIIQADGTDFKKQILND